MANTSIRLKIYGVRGSYPPTNGDTTHFGVNTTCLRIDIGKNLVIVDAGTGIINLGNDLLKEIKSGKNQQNLWKLHIFITHTHIDHLMGFPYFLMNYLPKTEIHFFSPRLLNYNLEAVLETLMSPALFPVTLSELPSARSFHEIGESKNIYFFENNFQVVSVGGTQPDRGWVGKISCMRNYTHPKGGAYVYKVESPQGNSVVFATDVEGFVGGDQRIINFSQNAKVLIHDAQYSPEEYQMFQGFGHSTYEMACGVAQKARVGKLVLFHHDPKHNDNELTELEIAAKKIFPETYMATEEMEFVI